jgi:acyl-CoA thioesterase
LRHNALQQTDRASEPMTQLHPFDEASRLVRREDGVLVGRTSPAYWNFAGPFGGMTAAIMLRSVLEDPSCQGTPVAMTINFAGLVAEGEFEVVPRLVRGGRITQHWAVDLRQGDRVPTTASFVLARRAPTWELQPATMPEAPPPESVESLDTTRWMPWLSNYQFRFVSGAPVLSRRIHEPLHTQRSVLWLNDRIPRRLDWLSLAALSDAFFPRVLHARGIGAKMGTVTLTTYFHCDQDELDAQGEAPVLGVADGERFSRSFQDQRIQLWGRDGRLLAVGGQVLWYES